MTGVGCSYVRSTVVCRLPEVLDLQHISFFILPVHSLSNHSTIKWFDKKGVAPTPWSLFILNQLYSHSHVGGEAKRCSFKDESIHWKSLKVQLNSGQKNKNPQMMKIIFWVMFEAEVIQEILTATEILTKHTLLKKYTVNEWATSSG